MPEVDQEERQREDQLDPLERKAPFFLRVELYLPLILIGGISLAVLLYARAMTGAGWNLDAGQKSVVGAFVEGSTPILLYSPPGTKNYLAKVGGNYEVLLKQWRDYLKEHKHAYRESEEVGVIAAAKGAVVVIPSAVALSEAERKTLLEHQKRGGSILATGPIGARDSAGNWFGWNFIQELFGARVLGEVDRNADRNFVIAAGETPITSRFAAGARFWVGKNAEGILRFEGGQPAGRVLDWTRAPDWTRGVDGAKGASIVYGEKGGARWVLFGFTENAWDPSPTAMSLLIEGSLEWLKHEPSAVLAAWPQGFGAAHVVTMNVDDQVENASTFAASLDAVKMRGTFFVVADAAARAPQVVKALAPNHELAYHGDTYKGFKDLLRTDQAKRVKAMQDAFQAAVRPEARIVGFRSPGELYDARTEDVLQSAGIRYHAADPSRSDARLPLFAKANRVPTVDDLVVLPRTQRDDVAYLHAPDAQLNDVIALMKGELGLVLEQGALGMLSVHSRNFARESVMAQAVPAYLVALAEMRPRIWMATGSDVAEWWRKRDNLRVTLKTLGKRYEIELSNLGEATVEGATAIVFHPRAAKVLMSPTKAWMPEFSVRRVDDLSSKIVFGPVGKGHFAYKLVFE
jgi:hypothetical protein